MEFHLMHTDAFKTSQRKGSEFIMSFRTGSNYLEEGEIIALAKIDLKRIMHQAP